MAVTLAPVEVILEHRAGELGVARLNGVAREGERSAQRAAVLAEHALVGGASVGPAAGEIGDQRAMVAQIELRPFGLLGGFERRERGIGIALGLLDPGDGERACQLADGTAARCLEMLFGLLEGARP